MDFENQKQLFLAVGMVETYIIYVPTYGTGGVSPHMEPLFRGSQKLHNFWAPPNRPRIWNRYRPHIWDLRLTAPPHRQTAQLPARMPRASGPESWITNPLTLTHSPGEN